jgi:type 1 fimbria pilin
VDNSIRKTAVAVIIAVLIGVLSLSSVNGEQNQAATTFTSADHFSIPEQNANINFAFNGSYTEATLENGTWSFKGLVLNNTEALQAYGFSDIQNNLGTLKISAENSNVTVLAFVSLNFSFPIDLLTFTVEGWGTQTVDLGLNSTQPTHVAEWSVVLDEGATFLAEGSGWNLLPDNSVRINGGVGDVTVMHYYLSDPAMANLSFFMQHYLVIFTTIGVAVTLAMAALITLRRKRRKDTSP